MDELNAPDAHEEYWKMNHNSQPFARGRSYDEFASAYKTGYEGFREHGPGKPFEFVEKELRQRYESQSPRLSWENASFASKVAWERAAVLSRSAAA